MTMFDYEQQRAGLGRQFEQESALADYTNFLRQQGFREQREDTQRAYGREFPRFTGQAARRLGSGIKSGVFRQQLGENVQDYNRLLQRLGSQAAQSQSQFQLETAARRAAYERALADLQAQAAMGMMNQGLGFGGAAPAQTGRAGVNVTAMTPEQRLAFERANPLTGGQYQETVEMGPNGVVMRTIGGRVPAAQSQRQMSTPRGSRAVRR
jgi:hypothetical protein